jgi:hypothetical protein
LGKFVYGAPTISVEFDDRVLAHIKVVIVSKLRRGESFTFSWEIPASMGSGYSSIWLHPSIPLQFQFSGSREPALNRRWLEELNQSANTPAGLRVMPEPSETPQPTPAL